MAQVDARSSQQAERIAPFVGPLSTFIVRLDLSQPEVRSAVSLVALLNGDPASSLSSFVETSDALWKAGVQEVFILSFVDLRHARFIVPLTSKVDVQVVTAAFERMPATGTARIKDTLITVSRINDAVIAGEDAYVDRLRRLEKPDPTVLKGGELKGTGINSSTISTFEQA